MKKSNTKKNAKPTTAQGKKVLRCAICGAVIEDGCGNNPYPLLPDIESRVCDRCDGWVMEARNAVDVCYRNAKAKKRTALFDLLEKAKSDYKSGKLKPINDSAK